jgi:hypothetical protein
MDDIEKLLQDLKQLSKVSDQDTIIFDETDLFDDNSILFDQEDTETETIGKLLKRFIRV